MTDHHGWQPAAIADIMWMASVAGEFLPRVNEDVQVGPLRVPMPIIDDPISNLEAGHERLAIVFREKSVANVLKQVGLLLYYYDASGHKHASSPVLITHLSMDS